MTDHIYRGQEAQRLLSEPLIKEIFASLETEAMEAAIALASKTGPDAEEARRVQLLRVKSIRDVRQYLESLVFTGKETAQREE